MEKIIQMLTLQQKLNDATNGKGWEKGVTKNGKLIDWRRCAYLECAELIESYPWKHWKNIDARPDYENIKIEVVDIWHFIMSQGLKEYATEGMGSIEDLAEAICRLKNYPKFFEETSPISEDYYAQIEIVETLVKALLCHAPTMKLTEAFIEVAISSGLTLDTLYKLYIGKNILNTFRQDHGYKEGNYIKIWNGQEDNAVMQQILETVDDITPDALYAALEESYPKR